MSVYPSAATDRLLNAVPGCTLSGRISQAADAYMEIMQAEIAAISWTHSQWGAVLEGTKPPEDEHSASVTGWGMAWASILNSADRLSVKWNVDAEALAQEVRRMSVARKLAVVEASQRFWAHSRDLWDKELEPRGVSDRRLSSSGITPRMA